jgi:hypothetical protein
MTSSRMHAYESLAVVTDGRLRGWPFATFGLADAAQGAAPALVDTNGGFLDAAGRLAVMESAKCVMSLAGEITQSAE